jgi:ATPase, P-type (transporting), HAD superfamily, subfamily IC
LKKQETTLEHPSYDFSDNEAFSASIDKLAKKYGTNLEAGLTQQAAEERLRQIGPNVVPRVQTGKLKLYLEPLKNWLIIIYVSVSAALALLAAFFLPQLWLQISLWLPIVLLNISIVIVQTARAQNKLTALQKLSAPQSHVVRDKQVVTLPAENLVPGDILVLKQGDFIPADCRIIESSALRVNEAALTGEAIETEKAASEELTGAGLLQKNSLFFGTFIVSGSATALVTQTGGRTQLGVMASKLGSPSLPEVSIRKRINKLTKQVALLTLVYLVVSITYNLSALYLNDDLLSINVAKEVSKTLTTSLSIMPINVPLLITTIMLTGALFLAEHEIIIRNLNAIESLGRVSVLCTDKTGTITKNRMTAKWIYLPTAQGKEQLFYIKSQENSPQGRIIPVDIKGEIKHAIDNIQSYDEKDPLRVVSDTPLECMLAGVLLNNEIFIVHDKKRTENPCSRKIDYTVSGDATDTAMLCLFERSNLDPEVYRERYQPIHSWPLDAKTRLLTSVFKDVVTEKYVAFTKGATETFLEKCRYVLNEKLEAEGFTQENKALLGKRADQFAELGQRIISFGVCRLDNFDSKMTRAQVEESLVYMGFIAITDPPREGVQQAVKEIKQAGITPVMMTGDSPITARSIAKEVGLLEDGQLVVEGGQIGRLTDDEFNNTGIFARISPEDKTAIVARYQKQNCVVAMTGDGVNDAQAISKADVGIAMGASGTDIARQTAHIVLGDDSFSSIVKSIREGRGVFEKIQNIVFFYIAVNLAEALIYYSSTFFHDFFFLQNWQMVYIFGTAHLIPPLALILDKISSDNMRQKPRSSASFITGKRRVALIVFTLSLALVLSISYIIAINGYLPVFDVNKSGYLLNFSTADPTNAVSWAQAKARTMFLSVAIIAESTLVLSLRRFNKPLVKSLTEDANRRIWPIVLAIPITQLMLMYIPALQSLLAAIGFNLEIIALAPLDWLVVLALGLTPILLLESVKAFYNRSNSKQ